MHNILQKIILYQGLYLFFIIFSGCTANHNVSTTNFPEKVYSAKTSLLAPQLKKLADKKKLQKKIISLKKEQKKDIKQKIIPTKIHLSDNRLPSKKICMEIKNEKISIILQALAKGVGQNIMISGNVSGTATINVKNEP